MRKCRICEKNKNIKFFNTRGENGYRTECKKCIKELSLSKKRTKEGLIKDIYSTQKASSKKRNHPEPEYSLLYIREWLLSQELFHKLHKEWIESKYDRWSRPSIDRVDNEIHYTKTNIKLMTWWENRLNAAIDTRSGELSRKGQECKPVLQLDMDGNVLAEYHSVAEGARKLGVKMQSISSVCKGRLNTCGGYKWKFK